MSNINAWPSQYIKIILGNLLLLSLFACTSTSTQPGVYPKNAFLTSLENKDKRNQSDDPIDKASLKNITDSIMAEFTIRRGDLNDAYQRYIRIAKETEDKKATKRAADIALALNNLSYMDEASSYWLTLDKQDVQAYDLQFQALISTGKNTKASSLLAQAIDNNISLNFLSQEVSRNSRETEKIKNIYESILLLPQKYKNNTVILMVEVRLDFTRGNLEETIAKALNLKDKHGVENLDDEIYLILAFSQKQTDQIEAAIQTLKSAIEYYPQNLHLITSLLDFLLEEGKLDDSRSYFENTKLEPHQALQLTMNYAGQLIDNGFARDALVQLDQIDYQSSGLADQFHYLKATALASINRKAEALNSILKTDGILKTNATQQAAIWMHELGKSNQINNMVLMRIDRVNNLDMVLEISSLHEEFKRLDLADELLLLTLQQHPNKDNIRYRRALINEQIGLWSEAEQELRYLIEKSPDNPQYLNALGYMLLVNFTKIAEAMELIRSAYNLSDNDPAIIDSLGWGYFLQGDTAQAIKYLEEAWRLLKDPEIGAHLGEALWLNDTKRANQIWKESLKINNEHNVLLNTIRRIDSNSPLLNSKQENAQ